jgi:NAD(P)-dependent dehydrogenase (short-subunit alcohol dehydrogenase family)
MAREAFADRIVLVTGASSGIGRESAIDLARKGAKAVTLFARRKEVLDEVAKEIQDMEGGTTQVLVVVGDVTEAEDNERAVKETVATFGGITGAFLNAGGFRGIKPLDQMEDEDIDFTIDLNMKSVIYALRYLVPAIKATVGEDGPTGSIVVNSSAMAVSVIAPKSNGCGIYAASKAFVNSLVETAAIENAPRIRVNSVMPGLVQTNIAPLDDEAYNNLGKLAQPLWGRVGKSVEIASLVSYLIGNEASFISGTHIKADGLWSLSGQES